MALEASEVAVRVRLLGGAAFKTEAAETAGSLDEIGAAGKRASSQVGTSSSGMVGGLSRAHGHAKKLADHLSSVGRAATAASIPIIGMFYEGGKAAANYNQQMLILSTQANLPYKQLSMYSREFLKIAPKFGQTATAMAQSMYPIFSIGLKGAQALNTWKAAAMGAAIGGDTVSNTTDALTSIMRSGIAGRASPAEIMAVMDRAVGLGKTHLPDLIEAMKSGLEAPAKRAGVSYPQLLAALSAETEAGIPASIAATRMRLTLTSMQAPTQAGIGAMAQMGLSPFALAGDLRSKNGLITALQDIAKHTEALHNPILANDLIAEMFGKSRGIASIGTLLNVLGRAKTIYGDLQSTTPALLQKHFAQQQQTDMQKYHVLQAELDADLIRFGDAINNRLLPILVKLIPYITMAVNWFTKLPKPIQEFAVELGLAAAVGGPILMFLGGLTRVTGVALGLASRFLGLGTAAEAAEGETASGGLLGLAGSLTRAVGALALFTAALAIAPKVKHAATRAFDYAKHPSQGVRSAFTTPARGGTIGFGGQPTNSLGTIHIPFIGNIHIPGLASGGLTTGAGLALVGEAGPELMSLPRGARVQPLPTQFRPDLMSTAFPGNLFNQGLNDNQTIVTQVVLDGKVVAQAVNNANRKIQNRR